MAAAASPSLEVRLLDRNDDAGPEEAWPQTLFLCQFPNASVITLIEGARIPVLAFLDDARDAIAYVRRSSSCSFTEALRTTTSAAVANRILWHAKSALVICRGRGRSLTLLIDEIVNHLNLRVPPVALSSIKEKYGGVVFNSLSLEESLKTISSYSPPGDWSKELSSTEVAIARHVLEPMILMALQEQCVPVKWTREILSSADRPNDASPIVADLAGPARYLYFGPYLYLAPGTYRARLVAGFSESAVGVQFTVDVSARHGAKILARARIKPNQAGILQGQFVVVHDLPQEPLEARLHNDESELSGKVGLAWVEFELVDGEEIKTRERD